MINCQVALFFLGINKMPQLNKLQYDQNRKHNRVHKSLNRIYEKLVPPWHKPERNHIYNYKRNQRKQNIRNMNYDERPEESLRFSKWRVERIQAEPVRVVALIKLKIDQQWNQHDKEILALMLACPVFEVRIVWYEPPVADWHGEVAED